jgi:hypothetical protein
MRHLGMFRRGEGGSPWQSGLLALLLLVAYGPATPVSRAQSLADVEIGAQMPNSPQPTTYSWQDERQTITDPGSYYYYFYYTGTVQPDARVNADTKIERIPVRLNEWEKHRRRIIAKLTNYYQVNNGMQPTALRDYQNELRALGSGGEETPPAGAPTSPPPGGGGSPSGAGPMLLGTPGLGALGLGFDAKAAAEWTFYYDQLVLWQYYCARVLLNDKSDAVLEAATMAAPASAGQQQTGGSASFGGLSARDFDTGLAVPPSQIFASRGNAAAPPPPVSATGQAALRAREIFNPLQEYANPASNLKYRDVFIDKAGVHEQELYNKFIGMLSAIDQRGVNREKYNQWLAGRQAQILDFAENWRKLREGETVIIDNTLFLITPEELSVPPLDAINLSRTERLTPQDLLNTDGTVKKPLVQ